MNYPDSSSDDVPYLPPEQFANYEQERNNRLSQTSLSQQEQRRGRSHFTEDELRELDSPSPFVEIPINSHDGLPDANRNTIPEPPSLSNVLRNSQQTSDYPTYDNNNPFRTSPRQNAREIGGHSSSPHHSHSPKISWGRRIIGILLITIPAVLFSVAAHFVDWPMNDFQLFSASFFIFQGVFWPSFGILLMDLFCTAKKSRSKSNSTKGNVDAIGGNNGKSTAHKWIVFGWTMVHSNLTALAMIFQLLSIQRLNISTSLALSFGFDVVVTLIRHILSTKACSPELVIFSVLSYAGFAVTAIPAFVSSDADTRHDTAVGVGASVGVMLLGIPSAFILGKLRQERVPESVLGTSFAFFGCIHSILTKEIMGDTFNIQMNAQAVGWAAGLISVVFLGTIFLFLETKLSALIWQRDDDRPRHFSSITRTRLAVFILSCLWELSRQGFRETVPDPYDVMGGFLVMLSFLLASGYQAWSKRCQNELFSDSTDASSQTRPKFCAFIPWLCAQKSYRAENEK